MPPPWMVEAPRQCGKAGRRGGGEFDDCSSLEGIVRQLRGNCPGLALRIGRELSWALREPVRYGSAALPDGS
jgi:hypothetical protein